MDRWILQMGFPLITLDTKTGSISQKHFLLDPESNVTRPSEFNYLWIVPIASIRNGVEQDSYWLEDTKEGNPALPWWTAAPGPHSQPVAHVLGVTAALSGLPSSFYSPSGAAFFGPYSSATQPWASYQPSWAPSFHLCDEAKNIYPTDLRED